MQAKNGQENEVGGFFAVSGFNSRNQFLDLDASQRIRALTEEQVEKWKIPENPEKPGEYQWEALYEYIDLDSIRKVEELEEKATKKWVEILEDLPGSLSQ